MSVLRDDIATIPWPDYWDFPSGGREGDEAALTGALLETEEEIGLPLSDGDVISARRYQRHDHFTWFFAAQLPAEMEEHILLGDEGQRVKLMSPHEYLTHPKGIPYFQTRLADFLADTHPDNPDGTYRFELPMPPALKRKTALAIRLRGLR